jgi:ABC-type nitrate/sulfonate/bicarbonate transport system substrate-binding protein
MALILNRRRACVALGAMVGSTFTTRASANHGDVRFSTPGPALTMLPMEVVRVKGMDKSEGFRAVLTQSPGSIAIKALVAGDFDFSLSAGAALIAAVNSAPIRIIYVHVDKWLYFLYSRENISGFDSLRNGKRIGVDSAGGTLDIIVRRAAKERGIDVGSTVFVAMGNINNVPGALIAGAIDAGVITPPQEFQLTNSSAKFNNLGFLGDYAPGLTGGIATTTRVLQQRPEMVRAVLRAQAKAHRFILNERAEVIPILSSYLNLSLKDAEQSYDTTIKPYYNTTGVITSQQQDEFVRELAVMLKLPKTPEANTLFDFSYIPG